MFICLHYGIHVRRYRTWPLSEQMQIHGQLGPLGTKVSYFFKHNSNINIQENAFQNMDKKGDNFVQASIAMRWIWVHWYRNYMSIMSPLLQINLLCCLGFTDSPPITKTGRCHDVQQSSMVFMMLRVELPQIVHLMKAALICTWLRLRVKIFISANGSYFVTGDYITVAKMEAVRQYIEC